MEYASLQIRLPYIDFSRIFAEGSSSHTATSAMDQLSEKSHLEASEIKLTWYFHIQMFRKVLVCRRDVFFRLKILSFGKKCDEVVQMKSRGIRKAIFCEILTYSERAESQLSPKVSLTTICDLHLLLRVPDRRGYFPSLRRSWWVLSIMILTNTKYK